MYIVLHRKNRVILFKRANEEKESERYLNTKVHIDNPTHLYLHFVVVEDWIKLGIDSRKIIVCLKFECIYVRI